MGGCTVSDTWSWENWKSTQKKISVSSSPCTKSNLSWVVNFGKSFLAFSLWSISFLWCPREIRVPDHQGTPAGPISAPLLPKPDKSAETGLPWLGHTKEYYATTNKNQLCTSPGWCWLNPVNRGRITGQTQSSSRAAIHCLWGWLAWLAGMLWVGCRWSLRYERFP